MTDPTMTVTIGGRKVGLGQPTFIIAEAGTNHNGNINLARQLIDVAADAGATAVKFQTFDPNTLVTAQAEKADYQVQNEGGETESQRAMLARLQLPRADHLSLKHYAEERNLLFLSTPFSLDDAEFLRDLGMPAIKVASTDTNNIPYLRTIAGWGIPIILSTGMSDLQEVKESVDAIRQAGNHNLIVLHCTTNYPCPPAEVNLRAIATLRDSLQLPSGYSDHTMGIEISVAAVVMGAVLLEKHFTLDRTLPGPDHAASLEPAELKEMIRRIRLIETAMGDGQKRPTASELGIAQVARKSLVAARSLPAGTVLTADDIVTKRPGTGLPPKYFDQVIGKKVTRDIGPDEVITKEAIAW